jgi:hypothetical protein
VNWGRANLKIGHRAHGTRRKAQGIVQQVAGSPSTPSTHSTGSGQAGQAGSKKRDGSQ